VSGGGRFLDRSVLVTGGSRGIGRAVALAFAREGADVVVNYAGNDEAAAEVRERVEALGRRCRTVRGSVADPATAGILVATALEAFGRIDVLVNNAGINRDGYLMMMRDDAWRDVVAVNLHGTFHCCRAVLGPMAEAGGGAIVNMSSTAGLKGRGGQVNYAATKGAVIALTKALALEVGGDGIRVNAVAPGFVETEMVSSVLARPEVRQAFLDATPLGRFGSPEEVAAAVLFLAAPDSAFVTGHVLLANGGLFV
jgi:3-oxoacyl-[acyl-carrier protein] reductase